MRGLTKKNKFMTTYAFVFLIAFPVLWFSPLKEPSKFTILLFLISPSLIIVPIIEVRHLLKKENFLRFCADCIKSHRLMVLLNIACAILIISGVVPNFLMAVVFGIPAGVFFSFVGFLLINFCQSD